MQELARQLRMNEKNIVVELNCQGYQAALEFYQELYHKLPKDLQTRLKDLLTNSKTLPGRLIDSLTNLISEVDVGEVRLKFRTEWEAYIQPLDDALSDFFKDHPNVFLFLDELPYFFQNLSDSERHIQDIQRILTSLRIWRQGGLAMGVAGSLNLHQQLEGLGISRKLLAGLTTLRLKPFSRESAHKLLEELLKGKNYDWWTNEITEKLLELMPDYVPYFIQLAFHHLAVNQCKTPEEVEHAYHNDIAPNYQSDFTYQFDDRLGKFSKESIASAKAILDCLALQGPKASHELQATLGDKFQYDALTRLLDFEFITLKDEQYVFSLNILKDWWRQKNGLK